MAAQANIKADKDEQSEWIKDPDYNESIINVIGEAIGDCMARENEFKCIDRQALGDKVIIFKDTDYIDYTDENWNAVMLYNYVNMMINNERYRKGWGTDTEGVMQHCYDRLARHYNVDNTEKCTKKLNKLEQQEKLIMVLLGKRRQSAEECVNKNKGSEDVQEHEQDLKNITELQNALENFNQNAADPALYGEAMSKLTEANTSRQVRSGNISYNHSTLDTKVFLSIREYLNTRRETVAQLAIPKKLEKAKNDIIAYVKALDLEAELTQYVNLFSIKKGSPANRENKKFRFKHQGTKYEAFRYSILMDLEVKKDGQYGAFPIIQTIGYEPLFIVGPTQAQPIHIASVCKVEWKHSKNFFYEGSVKDLAIYQYDNEAEYIDLLKLLQGLVEPLKLKGLP